MSWIDIAEYFLQAVILVFVALGGIMLGIRVRKNKNEKEGQDKS